MTAQNAFAETSTGRAVASATAIARRFGLDPSEAVVFGGHSNTMVHLAPLPLVVRVATGTGLVRSGPAWLAREVEVARYLAAVGAPAVRPSTLLDPGPHMHDGIAVSFWELVAIRPELISQEAAGQSLRRCHEALEGYEGELPALGVIDETLRLLDYPRVAASLGNEDRLLLDRVAARWIGAREFLDGVRLRPVHGDAHLQNLWCTEAGPIWGDWGRVRRPARVGFGLPRVGLDRPWRRERGGGATASLWR